MARPNKGLGHVDGLTGNRQTKERLRAVLSTLLGVQSVDEVCKELGIRRTHFQELRARALGGAMAALEPRPPGRKPMPVPVTLADVHALQQRVGELEREVVLLRAQLELALAMPELVQEDEPRPKRRAAPRRPRRPEASR